jgi:DEAD/DEAH box helicase domain-containing protein
MLQPARALAITQPLMSGTVSVSTQHGELIDEHLLTGDRGQFAEVLMKVADFVVGYRCGSTVHCYRDLRGKDRRMKMHVREFATTGVLLQIKEHWFRGKNEHALKTRKQVAEALTAVLSRDHGIAPSEIRTAHHGIALYEASGPRPIDDAIVIFDNIVGGLRLTTPLFSNFIEVLDRLERASDLAGEDAILDHSTTDRLRAWYESLSASKGSAIAPAPDYSPPGTEESGALLIYAPGSVVGARLRGTFQERRLIAPRLASIGDNDVLGYEYECEGGSGWLPHDTIEPIGHEWRHALWTPSSNEIREVAA